MKQYPWINQGVTFSKKVQTQLEKFVDDKPKITGKLDRTIKKDNPKIQGYPFYIYQAYLN